MRVMIAGPSASSTNSLPQPDGIIKNPLPGDSKWPFHPLVEGHLTFEWVTFSPSQKGHKELPGTEDSQIFLALLDHPSPIEKSPPAPKFAKAKSFLRTPGTGTCPDDSGRLRTAPEPLRFENQCLWYPKMDKLYKGKNYFLMDDLGGKRTPIFGNTHIRKPRGTQSPNSSKHLIAARVS